MFKTEKGDVFDQLEKESCCTDRIESTVIQLFSILQALKTLG